MVAGAFVPAQTVYAQQSQTDAALPTVTVSANGDLPETYAGGQVAKGARLGVLGNLDVMETPFAVVSYTSELIQNQQARTLADVLANDPSVRFTTSSGHMYENFRIRGFDVGQNDIAINGMYGLAPLGHVPVEFLERVEVLKGPSALFSGMAPSGAVGGTVNLVPKRAGNDPVSQATATYQSGSQFGGAIDIGRRFGEQKEWGLRINSAFSNGATEVDGQTKKREFISGALDYRNGPLTVNLDAYHSKEVYSGGTPAMYWFASTVLPAPSPTINQFRNGYGDMESNAAIAHAEYRFSDHLTGFAGLGTLHSTSAGFLNGTHARSINAQGNYTGIMVGQRGYTTTWSAEAGLRSTFKTGSVSHDLVLQASNLDIEEGNASNTASFTSNIYNPVTVAMVSLPTRAPRTGQTSLSSLALVDTLSFMQDAVRFTVGLRNQNVNTKNYNATTGAVTSPYEKSAVTPALALVVKPWGEHVSLYANYVQGLSKGDTVSVTGANYPVGYTFAPYKTEQKEVGVKWNAGTFTNTIAVFQIDKPILMSTGTSPSIILSDGGEKRMRGVEWETFGEIARGVRLLGGVTYSDGVLTKTTNHQYDGKAAVGAPRLQANLGTEWDTPWMPGLTLSSRVQATSSQYLDSANTQEISGWAQLDLGARYATKMASYKTVWRLGVANVFNRYYYSGSFSDSTPIATLGQARTISASVSVDF